VSDSIEQRIAACEAEIVHLRRETAEARALAAGADRDTADVAAALRGHGRTLSALRETQIEHGEAITELRAGMGRVESGMAQIVRMLQDLTDGDAR
jgi:chromosome segregation ATPase